MKLQEHQARDILAGYGIAIPVGHVVTNGGRGRGRRPEPRGQRGGQGPDPRWGPREAGGVKLAASPRKRVSMRRFSWESVIKETTVRRVLVAQAVTVSKAFYLGAVIDRAKRAVSLMASGMGGIDIEEVAARSPESIVRVSADPMLGLADYQAGNWRSAVAVRSSKPFLSPPSPEGFSKPSSSGLLPCGDQPAGAHRHRRFRGTRFQDGHRRQRRMATAGSFRDARCQRRGPCGDQGPGVRAQLRQAHGKRGLPGKTAPVWPWRPWMPSSSMAGSPRTSWT